MLKVKFTRIKNVLVAEILEQPSGVERSRFVKIKNDYILASERAPWLDGKSLWIRGYDKSSDNIAVSYTYDTEKKAKEAMEGFTCLIKSYNGTCPCSHITSDNDTEVIIAE